MMKRINAGVNIDKIIILIKIGLKIKTPSTV